MCYIQDSPACAVPNTFHLVNRYGGIWWERSQALPWKPLEQMEPGLTAAPDGILSLVPGRLYQLRITLTACSAGGSAPVFLRLAANRHTHDLPLFTLHPKEPFPVQQTVELYTPVQTAVSFRTDGLLGVCLVKAVLDGAVNPPIIYAAG